MKSPQAHALISFFRICINYHRALYSRKHDLGHPRYRVCILENKSEIKHFQSTTTSHTPNIYFFQFYFHAGAYTNTSRRCPNSNTFQFQPPLLLIYEHSVEQGENLARHDKLKTKIEISFFWSLYHCFTGRIIGCLQIINLNTSPGVQSNNLAQSWDQTLRFSERDNT